MTMFLASSVAVELASPLVEADPVMPTVHILSARQTDPVGTALYPVELVDFSLKILSAFIPSVEHYWPVLPAAAGQSL